MERVLEGLWLTMLAVCVIVLLSSLLLDFFPTPPPSPSPDARFAQL